MSLRLATLALLVTSGGLASAQTETDAPPKPSTSPSPAASPAAGPATAKRPLPALPYTPSLDVTAMDRSVDPCVDFFAYSCGSWNKRNPIPPDQARWDVYAKLSDDNAQYLWGMLQEAAQPAPARDAATQKIGDHFAACMDEAALEKEGASPLQADLETIASLSSKDALAALLGPLHLGMDDAGMLFGFGSDQDFKNSSQVIGFATAGGLGLPDRDYYVKEDAKSTETRQRYLAHVQKMLALGAEA